MLKLQHPSTTLIVGPSKTGKTTLAREIIRRRLYEPNVQKIKWCYSYFAPWFLEEPNIEFIQGLPETYEKDDLIVIDDMMLRLNEKIADLFTAASHHCNVSVILILQNLFPRARMMRDISLNTNYIILFENPRDRNQVSCLARQLDPNNPRFIMDAYIKATFRRYGYLVIDLHSQTPQEYRYRENLFPDQYGVWWIYQPK